MKQSDLYRQNAENCTQMADAAKGEPAYNRFKRMEAAWLALAEVQDWLDGEQSPVGPDKGLKAKQMTGPRPAGRPWTLTDDDMLRKLLASGINQRLIAQKIKRSIGAIQSRISLFKKPRKRSAPKA